MDDTDDTFYLQIYEFFLHKSHTEYTQIQTKWRMNRVYIRRIRTQLNRSIEPYKNLLTTFFFFGFK